MVYDLTSNSLYQRRPLRAQTDILNFRKVKATSELWILMYTYVYHNV